MPGKYSYIVCSGKEFMSKLSAVYGFGDTVSCSCYYYTLYAVAGRNINTHSHVRCAPFGGATQGI